jgi:hypothetical protein
MFTFVLKSELVGLLNVPWFSCYPATKQFKAQTAIQKKSYAGVRDSNFLWKINVSSRVA